MDQTDPRTAQYGEIQKILCCMCGQVAIDPNPSNMCLNCIRGSVDVTAGIPKEATVTWCRACERYLQPPKYWSKCELESKELLTLCLKRIKGLNRTHLVDASWIWTEPHSRRLKIKLTVQKEIFSGTVIQQACVVEFVVNAIQCELCAKIATGQEQWGCVVQVRQRVPHKRMILYIEQLILKHGMHTNTLKVKTQPDGLDFFYDAKNQGLKMLEFISTIAPVKRIDAEQLVSSDLKNNTACFHYSYMLEVAPVCREDLICLPKALYTQLGGIGPVLMVLKMFSNIVVIDPRTLQAQEISGPMYWKHPFQALATSGDLTEYYVLDVEIIPGAENGRFCLADVTVCREDEVGQGKDLIVRSHLGLMLKEGDSVMGYDLSTINFNNPDLDRYPSHTVPNVILVRKHYPNQTRRRRRRRWQLRHLPNKELPAGITKAQEAREEAEMDAFMDELERDADVRANVNLYRNPEADMVSCTDVDDDEAKVPMNELLDMPNLADELANLDEETEDPEEQADE